MAAQDVTIRFRGDTRSLDRSLAKVTRSMKTMERNSARASRSLAGIKGAANRVSTALTAASVAFAGFAISRGVKGVIDATTTFEQFRAQLTTYLGDQRLANTELERLDKLATGLPQNVNDLTAAFVTLTRNGIDTSNESMKAFANIASANGKSVQQFALAIEDAMRGEFERIKEFGVKVSKEGDKYVARFGDQIIATETSATKLSQSLVSMGKEGGRFFGAAERQANDLGTSLSNLDASVEKAQRAIGKAGLAKAIQETANQITDLLEKNPQLIQDIGVGFTKAFLYAKEAAIVLAKNIDIIGYVLAGVFGAKLLSGILSFAGAIAGPMFTAFVVLGKVLKATALLAVRHPLIGAIALAVGGIEYLTGAVSGLAEKLGLIGDDSVMGDLVDEAGELGDTITGYVNKGLSYTSDLQERVNKQAEEYRKAMEEVNETMDDIEASTKRQEIVEKAKKDLADSQAKLFAAILADKTEELRVSQLTKEQQDLITLQKEAEKKLGRELLDDEKSKLAVLVRQTAQIEEQKKRWEEFKEALDKGMSFEERALGIIRTGKDTPFTDLEQSYDLAKQQQDNYLRNADISEKEHKQRLIELERQFNIEKAQIQQKATENSIRNMMREGEATKGLYNIKLSEASKASLQLIGQEEKIQQMVADRIAFEKKSETEKTQWAIGQMGDAFEALGQYNRRAFEASKALRIAEAIMNTYQAATLALATYPPPFGFIGAAVAVAAGLANVATIRSQQYSGRQLGGAVSMGESYIVGETGPEIFTPGASGRIDRIEGSSQPVEITFNINAVDAASVDELLVNRKGTIQQIISDAMLERGQRSRF